MIKHQVDLVNVVAKDCPVHGNVNKEQPQQKQEITLSDSSFDFDDEGLTQRPTCSCEAQEQDNAATY